MLFLVCSQLGDLFFSISKSHNKNAIIAAGNRLLKVDNLDNRPVSEEILKKLTNAIKKSTADAVIFSDFRHGIFNKESISFLGKKIKRNVLKIADSQVSNRWGNILDFKYFL